MVDFSQIARHGIFACLMGVVAAAASVLLCICVDQAYALSMALPWLIYLLPVCGVLSLLLYRWWKLPLNATTHTVVSDIRQDRPISPLLAPGILIGTCLSILGGGSVGKEAGALHMGASLGCLVARPFKLRSILRQQPTQPAAIRVAQAEEALEKMEDRERAATEHALDAVANREPAASASSGLVEGWQSGREERRAEERAGRQREEGMQSYAASLGMAATFSALFFAPLGSAMFVLELTRYKRSTLKHAPTILLACFIAFALARWVGIGDIIPVVSIPDLSWKMLGQCVIIGAACALGGTLFIRAIDGLQRATQRASKNYYLWVVAGGLLVAGLTLAFGWQAYEGTGSNQLALALSGRQAEWGFLIKALLTVLCLGLWFKGGEIMPTFTIGALLGASCTVMTGGEAGCSAAIGLVAFFAAMSRCPLAAFLMGCEIFGWAAAPLFAIAIAVSFPLGHDAGLYGRGATSVLRGAWKSMTRKGSHG